MHSDARPESIELAVVVPTFNERDNVDPLLEKLTAALDGIEHEVIFVDDDSPDGTAERVRAVAARNRRVRVLQRVGRRGLASACIEGMMSTPARYIAVMDADLQHDETILPDMLGRLKSGQLDLVVGTRNASGGSMGEFSRSRVRLSQLGRRLSRLVMHCGLSDPMSGYFVVDRRFLEEVVRSTSGIGFKILLDLVASARRPVRLEEAPYTFRKRIHGASKLDMLVGLEYMQLLLDKMIGDIVPPRFVIFSMVGAVGVALSVALLYALMSYARLSFVAAQTATTIAAMTVNFFLNNSLTHRDRRLTGTAILAGLLSFYAACAVGALINIRLAEFAKDAGAPWYWAGIFGLAVGAVWNYGVTAIITWRRGRGASAGKRAS